MKQVDGWLAQAFTLRTAETVEDAIAPAPATETNGPAPAVQFIRMQDWPQCAQSTGKLPIAQYAVARTNGADRPNNSESRTLALLN